MRQSTIFQKTPSDRRGARTSSRAPPTRPRAFASIRLTSCDPVSRIPVVVCREGCFVAIMNGPTASNGSFARILRPSESRRQVRRRAPLSVQIHLMPSQSASSAANQVFLSPIVITSTLPDHVRGGQESIIIESLFNASLFNASMLNASMLNAFMLNASMRNRSLRNPLGKFANFRGCSYPLV